MSNEVQFNSTINHTLSYNTYTDNNMVDFSSNNLGTLTSVTGTNVLTSNDTSPVTKFTITLNSTQAALLGSNETKTL